MTNQPPAPPPPGNSGGVPPPPSGGPTGAAGADIGPRIGARIIDFIIFYVVFAILAVIIIVPLFLSDTAGMMDAFGTGGFSTGSFVSSIVGLILVLGFYVLFETRMGGTPGKLMLSMKVRGTSGTNPTVEESVKRNLWLALSIVPLLGWLLQLGAAIYILVTISQSDRNVGWHDRFAGTTVVKG